MLIYAEDYYVYEGISVSYQERFDSLHLPQAPASMAIAFWFFCLAEVAPVKQEKFTGYEPWKNRYRRNIERGVLANSARIEKGTFLVLNWRRKSMYCLPKKKNAWIIIMKARHRISHSLLTIGYINRDIFNRVEAVIQIELKQKTSSQEKDTRGDG